jgi:superfamily II DNA/RNA helicase
MQHDRSNTVFVRSACANWLDPVRRQQPLERDSAPTERCALKGAARKAIVSTITSPAASVKQPTVSFASLKLAPAILDALVADGYEFPTPIQAQAIPPALDARDVLGIAQTGTGKTAAFALPILNRLLGAAPRGAKLPTGRRPKALVLAPTRELAAQIAESFASYGRHTPIRFAVIFGGVGQGPQVRALQQGIDILVATPGRLIDLLDQRLVNLSEIEFFVLDEADRMLDMGFIEPIRRIAKLLPTKRQTMLFSATMPKEIRHLADSLLNQPVTVTVTPVSSAVDRIDQKLYFVLKAQKTQLLVHLFDTLEMERTVVFTKTKHGSRPRASMPRRSTATRRRTSACAPSMRSAPADRRCWWRPTSPRADSTSTTSPMWSTTTCPWSPRRMSTALAVRRARASRAMRLRSATWRRRACSSRSSD